MSIIITGIILWVLFSWYIQHKADQAHIELLKTVKQTKRTLHKLKHIGLIEPDPEKQLDLANKLLNDLKEDLS